MVINIKNQNDMSSLYKNRQSLDVLFIQTPMMRLIKKPDDGLPLGLAYMVASLRNVGIRSLIYNADYNEDLAENPLQDSAEEWKKLSNQKELKISNKILQEFIYVIKHFNPKIIGFASKVVDIPLTIDLIKVVRDIQPSAKIIVGGPSTVTCTEFLLTYANSDYLVLGEGEQTFVELAQYILGKGNDKQIQDIKGIAFYDYTKQTVCQNEIRELISDLDSIPFADRDSMFFVNHDGEIVFCNTARDVIISRGCPYRCKFCASFTIWGNQVRFRSNLNVIEELKYLIKHYNQKKFIFWDDLFTSNRKRVIELCDMIIESNLNISWICLARFNTIDKELLLKMKLAGCEEIQLGLESGNSRILEYVNKGLSLQQVYEKLPALQNCGIKWRIYLIIGFPTETKAEIRDTIEIIEKIKPTYVDLNVFSPYPGTPFYEEITSNGLKGVEDYLQCDSTNPYHNYTGTIGKEEFAEICLAAFKYVDEYNGGIQRANRFLNPKKILNELNRVGVLDNGNILLFQCTDYWFVKRLIEILQSLNYNVNLILHKKFLKFFNENLSAENMYVFEGSERFQYDKLKGFVKGIIDQVNIDGIIIPCNNLLGQGYEEIEQLSLLANEKKIVKINCVGDFIKVRLNSKERIE